MKHLFQFALIAAVSFAGELLRALLPFPIPGSVYGMVLLLLLLCLKVIRLEWVETAGEYLAAILPALFVPSLVGITEHYAAVSGYLPALLCACVLVTLAVALVTGHVTQLFRRKGGNGHE